MMRTRWLSLLLVMNVLLLGACGYLLFRYQAPPRRSSGDGPLPVEPADASVSKPAQPLRSEQTAGAEPVVIHHTNKFHWSQIESTNYWTFIQNLRDIGCPQQTIKDIVVADIMKLFAQRRGQFYHNGREFKFWETNDKRALTARQLEEREKALSEIDKELPAVLRELLGINYERELNKYFVDTQEDDRRLRFLNEAKREQVLALRERFESLRENLHARAEPGSGPDREALRRIDEQHKDALIALLTPEEFEEYLLRASDTAERLRAELVGFDPSEAEFREIFRLAYDHDQQFAYASSEQQTVRDEDRRRLEREIKSVLGTERAADYDRTKNREYRDIVIFTRRYELPASTAQTIYEMKHAAEEARGSLLANRTLAPASREAALKAIHEETERTVRQALGDQLYSTYSESGGEWIQGLRTEPAAR